MRIWDKSRIRTFIFGIGFLYFFSFTASLGAQETSSTETYASLKAKALTAIKNRQAITFKLTHVTATRYDILTIEFKNEESALGISRYTPQGKLMSQSRYSLETFEEWFDLYQKTRFLVEEVKLPLN